jgi:hypothetical protein
MVAQDGNEAIQGEKERRRGYEREKESYKEL